MADNYLEKQREAYEARKAAWLKAKKFGKKSGKGHKRQSNVLSNDPSHPMDKTQSKSNNK